ncbi:MAG: GTPase ObgE [Elusimicrobiota bacterium]
MKFIDKVRVRVKAGSGGSGCLSFLHEKFREFGGPNGGSGGRGGDVVFTADSNVGTLLDFSYRPRIEARAGGAGKGKNKTGADADDVIARVPVGTQVFKNGVLLADLAQDGARVRAAAGGRGGRGNTSFKTQHNTAPRIYEKGEPGEDVEIVLEVKLIADVGLAGFPNAGKSTLLSRVSNARPKIADYPFTTLAPNLGIVKHKERSFVAADIPGLIEGAHAGKGLGGDFLRHVERTRVLIHLIDPLGFDGVSAADGVRRIEDELRRYSCKLSGKPRLLAVNKQDLPEGGEALRRVRARFRKRKVFGISAVTGAGVSELMDAVLAELKRGPRAEKPFAPAPALRTVKVDAGFQVERTGVSTFRVTGRFIERAASMTDITLLEALYRLQKTLRRIGVDRALKSVGVCEGDTVCLGSLEMDWTDARPQRPPKLSKRGRPR